MKRVKVMLSAILVMAIVAGALAFKVKTPNVCAYSKTINVAEPPASTTCPRVAVNVTSIPVTGASTQFAATLPTEGCPTSTDCDGSLTLSGEAINQ